MVGSGVIIGGVTFCLGDVQHVGQFLERAPRGDQAERAMEPPTPRPTWERKSGETSDALDLEEGIFRSHDPTIAAPSNAPPNTAGRKASPFQSAMSMLTFYINRASGTLSASRKHILDRAKDELREQFDGG
jgi:hypothetical protein